jgi:pilus assembly protein CpaF
MSSFFLGRPDSKTWAHRVGQHVSAIIKRQQGLQSISGEAIKHRMAFIEDFGPITPFLTANDVSEIMVNGPNKIFVEQNGKLFQSDRKFPTEGELLRVVRQLLTLAGKTLSPQTPMIDCRLSDGSRMTVTTPPVTAQTSFTIRRPTSRAQDLSELATRGAMSPAMAEFLRIAVLMRQNILIAGGTSCGKTTLLNALAGAIPKTQRLVTLEDTFEIVVQHPNWLAMETVFQGRGEGGTTIDMRALVSHALHLRPDRILLGEVRGGEALNVLQAMNSGHDGSMATIHASSPQDVISRLETLVLMAGYEIPLSAVRQQISRAINLIIQMRRTPEGIRQISAITEVTGFEDGHVKLQDIYLVGRHKVTGQMGYFPTGFQPAFTKIAGANGVMVPGNLFSMPASPIITPPPPLSPQS